MGAVEGKVFDSGVDAFERYFLQNSFPLTRAPIASGHPGSVRTQGTGSN